MEITQHAAQRFLERVMGKTEYTMKELLMAKEYLVKVFKNVTASSYAKPFALPGFENEFVVRHQSNTIITIIPKDRNRKS